MDYSGESENGGGGESRMPLAIAIPKERFSLYRNDVVRGLFRIPPSPVLDSDSNAPMFCMAFAMKDKTSIDALTQKALWVINHVKSYLARGESSPYIENMSGFKIYKSSSDKKKEKWVIMRQEHGENVIATDLNDQMSVASTGVAGGEDPLLDLKRQLNLHDDDTGDDGRLMEIDVKLRIHEVRRVEAKNDSDGAGGEDYEVGEVCDHYLMLTVQSPLAFSFRRAVFDSLQYQCKKTGESLDHLDHRRRVWNQMRVYVKDMLNVDSIDEEGQENDNDGSDCSFSNASSSDSSGSITDDDDSHYQLSESKRSRRKKKKTSKTKKNSKKNKSGKEKRVQKKFSEAEVTHGVDINNIDWMRVGTPAGFTCIFSVHRALDWIRNHFFHYGNHDRSGLNQSNFFLESFGILRRQDIALDDSITLSYCEYDDAVEKALEKNRKYNEFCRRRQNSKNDKDGNSMNGKGKKRKQALMDDPFGIQEASRKRRANTGRRMDDDSVSMAPSMGSVENNDDDDESVFANGPPVICISRPSGIRFEIVYKNNRPLDDGSEDEADGGSMYGSQGMTKIAVNGYPQCNLVMGVAVPVRLESCYSLVEFERHVKIFPASVTLDILRVMLALDVSNPRGLRAHPSHEDDDVQKIQEYDYYYDYSGHSNGLSADDSSFSPNESSPLVLDNRRGKEISFEELQCIVSGSEEEMGRPMLSNGDMGWHDHCIKSVYGDDTDSHFLMRERFDRLQSFVRLALGLSLTRSLGSDSYVNDRVAAYGRFMENDNGRESQKICLSHTYHPFLSWKMEEEGTHREFESGMGPPITSRMGDPFQEALCYLGHVVDMCNASELQLHADNVHYFMQLLISDVMLAINYHGGDVQGAANGIGATLIVRDGYGNYRHLFRDNSSRDSFVMTQGQVYSKSYGSGADLAVLKYKNICVLSRYQATIPGSNKEFITEVKRSSEMGLMHNVCNTVEKHGSEYKLVHMVNKTSSRLYSTELKAGNDAQSQSCMQAIAWLIARNTMSGDSNVFKSTREHEKTKARIPVEYKQVIYGYWVLCSNQVAGPCRERFRALAAVCRSVASGCLGPPRSDFMQDVAMGWTGSCSRRQPPKEKKHLMGEEQRRFSETAADIPKPLFLSAMCTCIVTSFMQWTGSLGKLPSSYVLECLMKCFYSELEMNSCFLNPDISSGGELSRLLQVSKARGVAMSLLGMAMEETVESGRRLDPRWQARNFQHEVKKEGHLRAVERCAMRLMTGNTVPSVAPCMMADTLEHLFRLDFMVLMQLLCRKFEVPSVGFNLKDLLTWLKTGNFEHCSVLGTWMQKMRCHSVGGGVLCSSAGSGASFSASSSSSSSNNNARKHGITPSQNCMYISHADGMRCHVGEDSSEFDLSVSLRVGSNLFNEYQTILQPHCMISEQNGGPDIVRGLIFSSANKQYAWPSVFGSIDVLQRFWQGRPPMGAQGANSQEMDGIRDSMSLCPLRIMLVEPRVAGLAVDIRWLLLIRCLCGGFPCQSSRFALVSRWVQHFYQLNVPDYMKTAKCVWTGMPSPFDRESFISVPVTESRYVLGPSLRQEDGTYVLSDKYGQDAVFDNDDDGEADGRNALARNIELHENSYVQRLVTRCMLKRWGVQKCLNEKIQIIGLDAPIISKVVEDMGPAAPRYEMGKVLGVPERILPTNAVSSYALPYGVWFPVLLRYNQCVCAPLDRKNWLIFASLLVMEDDEQQSQRKNIGKTIYLLNFKGHLIDITNDSYLDLNDEQSVRRTAFHEGNSSQSKQKERLVLSAKFMSRLVTKEGVSIPVECLSNNVFGNKLESCAFGLNGRTLVDVRPLCVFFRPGVLLRIENPRCNGCCDQSHYGMVHRYDANLASYEVMCWNRSIVYFNPYEVEDMVIPIDSIVYIRARAFITEAHHGSGGNAASKKTNILFYQKKKSRHQQQDSQSMAMSQGAAAGGSQQTTVAEDEVDKDHDVVECRLCIPTEDLQEAYVANGWRGNGVLSVTVIMFYDSTASNELESLYTECATKDGMKHVRHMSVKIQDTLLVQNPSAYRRTIFDCIGVKLS